MRSILTATLVGFLASAPVGCGSDGGSKAGPTSGVLATKTFATLTPAEKGQLCDWLAASGGGYGKSMTCSGGQTVSNDDNQASCVASIPSCSLTVAEFETCIKIVLAVPLCDQQAKLINTPECAPFGGCF